MYSLCVIGLRVFVCSLALFVFDVLFGVHIFFGVCVWVECDEGERENITNEHTRQNKERHMTNQKHTQNKPYKNTCLLCVLMLFVLGALFGCIAFFLLEFACVGCLGDGDRENTRNNARA